MEVTAFSLGQRFVGLEEVAGSASNAHILAMLRLDAEWPKDDSTPWCSAWVNYIAWLLRLPRSKSLAARSWLTVGTPIPLEDADAAFDVVILKRGPGKQPGPEVTEGAPGHVGFFGGVEVASVIVLGGNQSNQVGLAHYPAKDVLGVRRLVG